MILIKKSYFKLSALLFLFISNSTAVLANSEMLFATQKNKIQTLVQKFEYNITPDGNFNIGPIEITPSTFNIEPLSNKEGELEKFKLTWPKNLIPEGFFLIKNSLGKEVWRVPIHSQTLQLQLPKSEILSEIIYGSFFQYCVLKSDESTNVQICSGEHYFENKSKKMNLKKSFVRTIDPLALINGKKVTLSGIIILNKPSDTISLKAWASNRSYIELDTKHQLFKVQEAYLKDNHIFLKTEGADIFDQSLIENQTSEMTLLKLPNDFNYIYLKGQSGIPLKQEVIYTEKNLPTIDLRLSLSETLPLYTYSSTLRLKVLSPDNPLNVVEKSSQLKQEQEDKSYVWEVQNLRAHRDNIRFLSQKKKTGEDIFSYVSIYRDAPFNLSMAISYPISSEVSSGSTKKNLTDMNIELSSRYWLTNKFGASLAYQTQKINLGDEAQATSQIKLGGIYRLSSGTWNASASHNITLDYEQYTIPEETLSGFAVGYLGRHSPFYLKSWHKWIDSSISISALTQALSWQHIVEIEKSFYFKWGLFIENKKVDTAKSEFSIKNQGLSISVGTQF